ncbi:MAG: hypothetical protein OXH99_10115 [Bryobacterales bacterium]|nr:hypothetical protein [Bryobacterales bacterium]
MKKILDRIPRPTGAIPARAQMWLLGCLAAVIAITLVSFPGGPDPSADPGSETPDPARAATGVEVSSVEGAARRMREEAVRDAERRVRRELGAPEPRPDGLPQAPEPLPGTAGRHLDPAVPAYYSASPEEEIEREERLRRYRSLRAPPLVQSVRDVPGKSSPPGRANPAAGGPADAAPPAPGAPVVGRPDPPAAPKPSAEGVADTSTETYVLREGEFLEAVLVNRLSGEFTGPVVAMVSADVHDRRRLRLLVPRGARAIGRADRVEEWGQSRLSVVFHRLILPDGTAVELGRSEGLNQVGETGLRDRVQRHYPASFAAAGAVGILAGLSQAGGAPGIAGSRLGATRLSVGSGLSQAAERVLDRYLNRLPGITVREGHRVRIYLTEDLELPRYGDPRNRGKGELP